MAKKKRAPKPRRIYWKIPTLFVGLLSQNGEQTECTQRRLYTKSQRVFDPKSPFFLVSKFSENPHPVLRSSLSIGSGLNAPKVVFWPSPKFRVFDWKLTFFFESPNPHRIFQPSLSIRSRLSGYKVVFDQFSKFRLEASLSLFLTCSLSCDFPIRSCRWRQWRCQRYIVDPSLIHRWYDMYPDIRLRER